MSLTGYTFMGANAGDRSGISVKSAGDFSQDGLDDLLISARGGFGYLVASSDFASADAADGTVDGIISLSNIAAQTNSYVIDAGSQVNNLVDGGDIDGDGMVDILIRSTDAYLLSGAEIANADAADGSSDGIVELANVASQTNSYHFVQNNNVDRVNQIGTGGDFDDDGLNDIVIGGQLIDGGGFNNSGGSFLISAADLAGADGVDGTDGLIHVDNLLSQGNSYAFEGDGQVSGGYYIKSLGDLDGDGKDDFGLGANGAPGDDTANAGETFILHAADLAAADAEDGADNTIALANIQNISTAYQFNGENNGDRAASISNAGDYNNDGTTDFAITADLGDSVYLLCGTRLDAADLADGSDDQNISVTNISAQPDSYIFSASSAGDRLSFGGSADIDEDGKSDLLFNSTRADDGAEADVGVSYLLMGSKLHSADIADGAADGAVDVAHVSTQVGSYKIVGIGANDKMGGRFIGDMNGDGLSDLAFGAYFSDLNGDNSGASWVLYTNQLDEMDAADGSTDGVISLENANTVVVDSGIVNGTSGNDLIRVGYVDTDGDVVGDSGTNVIEAGDGDDKVFVGAASDTIRGQDGNDNLRGGGGDDMLIGGAGNDWLSGDAGADTMIGGIGNDAYYLDDAGDVVSEDSDAGHDRVKSTVNHVLGTHFEELWLMGTGDLDGTGNDANNFLVGSDGANTLSALGGQDTIHGQDGADIILAGAGDDLARGNQANDTLDGGAGNDKLYGGGGDDSLTGGEDDDKLNGGLGNDVLYGEAGSDFVNGGTGADEMYGGEGNDVYFVDNVNDIVSEEGGSGIDKVKSSVDFTLGESLEKLWLTGSAVAATGNDLNNKLVGNDIANIISGEGGTDRILAGNGSDTVFGGESDDHISGQMGHDELNGGVGDDRLLGASGNDTLTGGQGNDRLVGGEGDDVFVFESGAGTDRVFGFDEGDILQFSGLTYDNLTFSQQGGSARIEYGNDDLIILKDVTENDLSQDDFLFV